MMAARTGRIWAEEVGHIGRIVIDPRDQGRLCGCGRAALGTGRRSWSLQDHRWREELEKRSQRQREHRCGRRAVDPSNPDIIYAAAYQRRRHVYTLIDGGPESAIYKSTDAGKTGTRSVGAAKEDMGRIGLAISPADPNVVYAIVEAANGKGGISAPQIRAPTGSAVTNIDQGAMLLRQIVADPKNVDRIYVMNVETSRVADGRQDARER